MEYTFFFDRVRGSLCIVEPNAFSLSSKKPLEIPKNEGIICKSQAIMHMIKDNEYSLS